MYEVDAHDRVVEITDAPQSSVGAPIPIVVADEHQLLLAYFASNPDPEWDGTHVKVIDHESDEPVVVVEFERPVAHMFGPPNDEAFEGHPLADRGLHPYAVFRVERSSWVRQLETMNRVHPQHRSRDFDAATHFVFAFHDSTFECVSHGFSAKITLEPLSTVMQTMATRIGEDP